MKCLAYALFLFRDIGLSASHTLYAKVTINWNYNVFWAVEEINGRFAKHHFSARGDGNFYKEAWIHGDFVTTRVT